MMFQQIPNGAVFAHNGNKWLKRSSRTAVLIVPLCYAGAWFYFRRAEHVRPVQP